MSKVPESGMLLSRKPAGLVNRDLWKATGEATGDGESEGALAGAQKDGRRGWAKCREKVWRNSEKGTAVSAMKSTGARLNAWGRGAT